LSQSLVSSPYTGSPFGEVRLFLYPSGVSALRILGDRDATVAEALEQW
jgi:hypothetical protein